MHIEGADTDINSVQFSEELTYYPRSQVTKMKKVGLILIMLFSVISVCGCTPPQNTDGRYSAEFAYDPQQYTMFVNKELQAPINQMSDILTAIGKFEKGNISKDALYMLAQSGYETVSECIQAIIAMRPPELYTENTVRVTEYLEDMKIRYADLMELLEEEQVDTETIRSLSDRIHEGYLLITSETNAYWK